MAYQEDSSASGQDEPWIQWFCGLKGHEMFCEVERSYIEDGFNLYGLRACVSNFSDCLDLILDRIGPDDSDDSHLTQSACTLYGLIHARYIITAHGLDAMYNKYAGKEFGTCPLIQCSGQPVLPVGMRDEMGADTAKAYCPRCRSVYHPPPVRSGRSHHGGAGAGAGGGAGGGGVSAGSGSGAVDGAAFGTTFPHLFLMTFNNLIPDPPDAKAEYVPKVFGFRVHPSALLRHESGGGASGGDRGRGSSNPAMSSSAARRQSAAAAAAAAAAATATATAAAAAAASSGRKDDGGGGGPSNPPPEAMVPPSVANGNPAPDGKKGGGWPKGGGGGGKDGESIPDGSKRKKAAGGGGGGGGTDGSGGGAKGRAAKKKKAGE